MTSNAPVMLGMTLPDVDVWSERVTVALGQNPSVFSGPGTKHLLDRHRIPTLAPRSGPGRGGLPPRARAGDGALRLRGLPGDRPDPTLTRITSEACVRCSSASAT